jgi:hypothetical protein
MVVQRAYHTSPFKRLCRKKRPMKYILEVFTGFFPLAEKTIVGIVFVFDRNRPSVKLSESFFFKERVETRECRQCLATLETNARAPGPKQFVNIERVKNCRSLVLT